MAPTGYSPRLELEKNGSNIFSEQPCYSVVYIAHTHRGVIWQTYFPRLFATIITYAFAATITAHRYYSNNISTKYIAYLDL